MSIYGTFLFIFLYLSTQNKFNFVECVAAATLVQTQSQSTPRDHWQGSESRTNPSATNQESTGQSNPSGSGRNTQNTSHSVVESEGNSQTPQRELPSQIKITTENSSVINDKSKFTVHNWTRREGQVNRELYKIDLNDDANCTEVVVEDTVLWKYDGKCKHPLSILYEPKTSVVIKFFDGYLKFDKPSNTDEWLEESDIKLYTTDPFDASKAIKLAPSDYIIQKRGSEILYEFKRGVECNEVRFVEKKGDPNDNRRIHVIYKTVWKRWSTFGIDSKTIDYFPKAIRYKNHSRVIFYFDTDPRQILIRERDTKNDWYTVEKEVKLYEEDLKNQRLVEIDHSQYKSKNFISYSFSLEFKPGVRCVKAKVNEDELWQYNPSTYRNQYPMEVSFIRTLNRLVLRCEGYSIIYFNHGEGWRHYKNEEKTDMETISSTTDSFGSPTVWHTMASPRQRPQQSTSTDSRLGVRPSTSRQLTDQEIFSTNDPDSFPQGWHTYDYESLQRESTKPEQPSEDSLQPLVAPGPSVKQTTQAPSAPSEMVERVHQTPQVRQITVTEVEDSRAHEQQPGPSTSQMSLPEVGRQILTIMTEMSNELERLRRDYQDLINNSTTATIQQTQTSTSTVTPPVPEPVTTTPDRVPGVVPPTPVPETTQIPEITPEVTTVPEVPTLSEATTPETTQDPEPVVSPEPEPPVITTEPVTQTPTPTQQEPEVRTVTTTEIPDTIIQPTPPVQEPVTQTPPAPVSIALDISSDKSTEYYDCFKEESTLIYTPKSQNMIKMVKLQETLVWQAQNVNEYSIKVELTSNDRVIVHKMDGNKVEIKLLTPKGSSKLTDETLQQPREIHEEVRQEASSAQKIQEKYNFEKKPQGVNQEQPVQKQPEINEFDDIQVIDPYENMEIIDPADEKQSSHQSDINFSGQSHPEYQQIVPQQHEESIQQPVFSQADIQQETENRLETSYLILELSDKESSDLVTYECNAAKGREKFTCKPNNLVYKVMNDGYEVWEAKENRFPDRVLIVPGEDGNPMAEMLFPGDPDKSVNDGPDLSPEGSAQPQASQASTPHEQTGQDQSTCYKLITVNINNLQSTNEVDYLYDQTNKVHTFKVKSLCLIEKVVKGNLVVWKPTTEYGIELALYKVTDGHPKDKLTVYYPSDAEKQMLNQRSQ